MPRAQLEPSRASARFWGGLCTLALFTAFLVLKGHPFAIEMGGVMRSAVGALCVVDQIDVKGTSRTAFDDMSRVCHLSRGMSLTEVDVDQIKEALEGMPWICAAGVRRVFPGKVVIEVSEHVPFGVWKWAAIIFCDSAGAVIKAPAPRDVFLYRLWGREVPQYAPAFMKTLHRLDPVFAKQVHGLHRQPSGRMDVFERWPSCVFAARGLGLPWGCFSGFAKDVP